MNGMPTAASAQRLVAMITPAGASSESDWVSAGSLALAGVNVLSTWAYAIEEEAHGMLVLGSAVLTAATYVYGRYQKNRGQAVLDDVWY